MAAMIGPRVEIRRDTAARRVGRHHHALPGAALILRGGYLEAGNQGRYPVVAGDIVMHQWFDGHQVQLGPRGADILVLPFDPEGCGIAGPLGRVSDPDAIVRLAETDPPAALALLASSVVLRGAALEDWPDLLAARLREDAVPDLGAWARTHGLHPASMSRGFRQCYGISPQRFRLEQRVGRALRTALRGRQSLTAISAEAGFADQAHFSRTAACLFDRSPSHLRRLQA
jgi:AraC-like DNA-binding protein